MIRSTDSNESMSLLITWQLKIGENCGHMHSYKMILEKNVPITLFDRWIAFAIRSRCQATCHPFDGNHLAFSWNECGRWGLCNICRSHTGCIQNGENFGICCIGNGRLASHIVLLNAITSCDFILVLQQTEPSIIWQIIDHFCLSFDDHFAQFIATNWEFAVEQKNTKLASHIIRTNGSNFQCNCKNIQTNHTYFRLESTCWYQFMLIGKLLKLKRD